MAKKAKQRKQKDTEVYIVSGGKTTVWVCSKMYDSKGRKK